MNEIFTQLGVGGVLALLIIREVLNFLDKKRNGSKIKGNNPIDFETLYDRVGEIRKWEDSLQSIRPSLERIEKSLSQNGRILDRIADKLAKP